MRTYTILGNTERLAVSAAGATTAILVAPFTHATKVRVVSTVAVTLKIAQPVLGVPVEATLVDFYLPPNEDFAFYLALGERITVLGSAAGFVYLTPIA